MKARKGILTIVVLTLFFLSCEKEFTPETYFPRKGDKIEKVEKYWGQPQSRNVANYSGELHITYYYEVKRVAVWFIGERVDSWSTY